MPEVNTDRFNDSAFQHIGHSTAVLLPGRPECECGCWASLKINGNYRCDDCAAQEGVERIRE